MNKQIGRPTFARKNESLIEWYPSTTKVSNSAGSQIMKISCAPGWSEVAGICYDCASNNESVQNVLNKYCNIEIAVENTYLTVGIAVSLYAFIAMRVLALDDNDSDVLIVSYLLSSPLLSSPLLSSPLLSSPLLSSPLLSSPLLSSPLLSSPLLSSPLLSSPLLSSPLLSSPLLSSPLLSSPLLSSPLLSSPLLSSPLLSSKMSPLFQYRIPAMTY